VELATRRGTRAEWEELDRRSLRSSVGQERLEVLETIALTALREVSSDDSLDDDALGRLATITTTTREALRKGGFSLLVDTSNCVLAALPLASEHPDGERPLRQRALSLALDLHERLDRLAGSERSGDGMGPPQRAGAPLRLQVGICVYVDRVMVRMTPAGLEMIGGPIADLGRWARTRRELRGAIRATVEALEGLPRDPRILPIEPR
jgi:hypothetical protein